MQAVFLCCAYAHNEFEPFDPIANTGQAAAYLQGRRNSVYTGYLVSMIQSTRGVQLQSVYDRPGVTRYDGQGAGTDQFLKITKIWDIKNEIVSGENVGQIVYGRGNSPLDIQVVIHCA